MCKTAKDMGKKKPVRARDAKPMEVATVSEEPHSEEPSLLAASDPALLVGRWALVHGLVGRPELNGRQGHVTSQDEKTGRMVVEIGDEKLLIKPDNLALTSAALAAAVPKKVQPSPSGGGKPLQEIFEQFCPRGTDMSAVLASFPPNMSDMHWARLIVPVMAQFRKRDGTPHTQVLAWRGCERLLPICEDAYGPLSAEVAGLLLHQCNVYLDLKPGQRQDKVYAERCIEQSQRLQQCAKAAWLANGAVVALPFFEEEDGEVYSTSSIEMEALGHMGGAYFDLSDSATAQICYEQALRIAGAAGLGDSEFAARIHNNAAGLFQSLAAPSFSPKALAKAGTTRNGQRRTRQRDDELSKAPKVFDAEAVRNLNKALRHALRFLRYQERNFRATHENVGCALQNVGDLCFVFRLREPAVRHMQGAIRIFTAVFGRDHPRTESAERLYRCMSGTTAALAPDLDDDVIEGLSRHGSEMCCERPGCGKLENADVRFQICGSCRTVNYCSRECQTLDWRRHKGTCAEVSKVTDKQQTNKKEHKRLNRKEAALQEKFAEERERAEAPPEEAQAPVIACLHCAAECAEQADVYTCPTCEEASYCSADCRTAHTPTHERHCREVLRREAQARNKEARQLQHELDERDAPRRQAEAAAEADALARRVAALQAGEDAAGLAAREAALRRQAAIAEERAMRANAEPAPLSMPGPSHRESAPHDQAAPTAVDLAKRETEKEESLRKMHELARQRAELEQQRAAEEARREEMLAIGDAILRGK